VYEVIAVPPFEAGAVYATVAVVAPVAVAVPIVGAPGTAYVVTDALAADAVPVPTAFVAVTVYVYAVLLAPPVADIGDDAPVNVEPPGLRVAVYPVIAVPPVNAGAVNGTDCIPTPVFVTVPIVGAPGTVYVVILFEFAEAELLPAALVAYTEKVYDVLAVKLLTVIVPEPACDSVLVTPPGEDTAVYDVIACAVVPLPVSAGDVYVIVAVVEPVAVAVPIVGALGTVK
jgi:hypothetical protein